MDKILALFKSNQNIGFELKSRIRNKDNKQDLKMGDSFDKLRKIIDRAKRKQSWDYKNHHLAKK